MNHVTRNVDARRAQLGVTLTELEEATGFARQQFYRTVNNPEGAILRSMQKVAMMLFCPVEALLSHDPAEAVRAPLPPKTFVETLRANRARFGFDGGSTIDWAEYEATILANVATDATA